MSQVLKPKTHTGASKNPKIKMCLSKKHSHKRKTLRSDCLFTTANLLHILKQIKKGPPSACEQAQRKRFLKLEKVPQGRLRKLKVSSN